MIQFLVNGATVAYEDAPVWVYLGENGAYALCSREDAQGVVLGGKVYNLPGETISENGEVEMKLVRSGDLMLRHDGMLDELIAAALEG